MPLLFLIAAVASVVALSILALSIVLGAGLCFSKRFRTVGIYVLVVPTLSALLAVTASWGAAFLCDRLSHGRTAEAAERWQVLAVWAWPIGFGAGGIGGALVGVLMGILINRRRSRRLRMETSPAGAI
jgi:hypothetical protein